MAGQRAAAPEKKREKGGVRGESWGQKVKIFFSTVAKTLKSLLISN